MLIYSLVETAKANESSASSFDRCLCAAASVIRYLIRLSVETVISVIFNKQAKPVYIDFYCLLTVAVI